MKKLSLLLALNKFVLVFNPNDAKAHYNLGNTYGTLGRYQDAIKA